MARPAISPTPPPISRPPKLSPELASRYALHAMLAYNAYHKTDPRRLPRFAVEKLGWVLVDAQGQPGQAPTHTEASGLAYDIYEQQGGNEVVIAYRGTDSLRDFATANLAVAPFNTQYRHAEAQFLAYQAAHPDKHITLTGHSLGGGIALSLSVRHGVDAVTFDTSPRVFDGLHDRPAPALRVMVYQEGEVLALVRKLWKHKFNRIVTPDHTYQAKFDFGLPSQAGPLARLRAYHHADPLALGLLQLGAGVSAPLQDLLQTMRLWPGAGPNPAPGV